MEKVQTPEVVVVTGGTAGVGRATVQAFARRGAWVGILARDSGRLQQAKDDVERLGGRALPIQTDVSHYDQVEKAAGEIEQAFGPIDVWVNNAMVSVFAPFKDVTPEEFRRVNDVTYMGYVYGTMVALKRMMPRDRGTIVQVGSALAIRSIPLQSAYCGAKHAIKGFTDSIRSELLHDRSRVHLTMVQLPAVNTPQFDWVRTRLPKKPQPVPPIYQPDPVAEAIYWAAHRRRREVYVGIPTVVAVWGEKIAGRFADYYLARTNYQAQQTDEPEPPNRPDNLFHPVAGDFGAHGRFDDRAYNTIPEVWVAEHKKPISIGFAAAAGMVIAGLFAGKKRRAA